MGNRTPRGRFLAAPYYCPQALVWLLIFLLPSGASAVMCRTVQTCLRIEERADCVHESAISQEAEHT